jgi:hypothetical protein
MATANLPAEATTAAEPPPLDWLAAILSLVLPGLGQLIQGRVGKGLLFFGCLHLMFFYGQWAGQWQSVFLPSNQQGNTPLKRIATDLWSRPQFLAQVGIGAAAWPALYEYFVPHPDPDGPPRFGYGRAPLESTLNQMQSNADKHWDLALVYTMVAGVLNILVIYDALAGPALRPAEDQPTAEPAK